jgi:hypothetical protein
MNSDLKHDKNKKLRLKAVQIKVFRVYLECTVRILIQTRMPKTGKKIKIKNLRGERERERRGGLGFEERWVS